MVQELSVGEKATASLDNTYGEYKAGPIQRSTANYGRTFDNFYGNTSIKSQYGREDYSSFRNSEAKPSKDSDIISVSMKAYDNVGIIKNVIDLYGDFACKGIRLVHKNPKTQKFYREWFEHINGNHISERFVNYLYRIANVPIYTTYGVLPVKVQKKWESTYGIKFEESKVEKRRIPLRYNFINPNTIEPILPELSMFTGKNLYVLKIGDIIQNAMKKAKGKYREISTDEILALIPDEIKNLTGQSSVLPLSSDNLSVYFYKKDDWNTWAKPMIYSIMDDITELEKMKLADISALDGVISNIRLWRVGITSGDNPANWLLPSPSMLNKVREVLAMNVGGGSMDLVWGPDLDFKESNTQVHHFLGIEKYKPVYHSIYQGLGFGIALSGDGMGNAQVAMQTLTERLEYGRSVLCDFWNNEIKQVQKAMGFTSPAKVQFDRITFGDETGMMKLFIELSDRGIITDDMIHEIFDFFPDIVKKKLITETKARKTKKYPDKAGPYYNPNVEDELKKIILQAGGVTPSEVGLELLEKKVGEQTVLDKTHENGLEIAKTGAKNKLAQQKFNPPKLNGRPKNAKDTVNRKKRIAKADTFVSRFLWANAAQKKISDLVTEAWVNESCGKKDVRSLTTAEAEELELVKFNILCGLKPYSCVSIDSVSESFNLSNSQAQADMTAASKALYVSFVNKNNREPTLEEKRQIQASSFSLHFEEEESNEEITTSQELDSSALQIIGEI